jgi:hypothetical protein
VGHPTTTPHHPNRAAAADGPLPAATPVLGGPVIEIGRRASSALAVNAPRDVDLLRSPVALIGGDGRSARDSTMPADRYVRAAPTWMLADTILRERLYRLDLLVDGRLCGASCSSSPRAVRRRRVVAGATEPLDVALLRRLPEAATIWAFGSVLSGWSRDVAPDRCRVAEIWRATDVDDPCHPIPLGRPVALGVNLPGPQAVSSIRLSEVDPLPGPVESVERTTVDGRVGVALVEVASPGLDDGIYRLDVVTTIGRTLHWYVEVGPDPLG